GKIVGPSPSGYATSAGSLISLTGVVYGEADSITWEKSTGESGVIELGAFWLTDAIELNPGDNRITVAAAKGSKSASDSIIVTYNPYFIFQSPPIVLPYAVFKGESVDVVATIPLGLYGNFDKQTVMLHETNGELQVVKDLGGMVDDGATASSGDEIAQDGIYTKRIKVNCADAGPIFMRVSLTVKTPYSSYTAFSAPVILECVEHLSSSECSTVLQIQQNMKDLYQTKLKEGAPAAKQAVLDALKNNPNVLESGAGEDSIWALYKNGLLGVLSLVPDGFRGSSGGKEEGDFSTLSSPLTSTPPLFDIGTKQALLLAPYGTEFGNNDESLTVSTHLKQKMCPSYDVDGPLINQTASLSHFRKMGSYGIDVITSHGNAFFKTMSEEAKEEFSWDHKGSQEAVFTNEPVVCSNLLQSLKTCSGQGGCPQGTDCVITSAQGTSLSGVCLDSTQVDLRRGRLAIGDGVYAVLPSFVKYYGKTSYPESLVYLGVCKSLYNGTLASAFFGAGAKTIIGFTGNVKSSFAYEIASNFFKAMINEEKTPILAMPEKLEDPEVKDSQFLVFGAENLSISSSKIMNDGFERGDLTGWSSDGDGRVITKLGITGPVVGKFMGIISSGLGFTTQTGLIEQTFCIPAGITEFQFYWKFYSEEFHEWCGSVYQDTFTAKFTNTVGQELTVVKVSIDDLCNPDDCGGCCASEKCVGLIPSDVQFDQKDAHVVPKWQKANANVMMFAGGGPVTLSFFCTDQGDSIYDTVILFDGIKFK
ncbi:MAG: hypothetical protein FJ088_05345, partial [Deltaproteobacteria bacterium]|nr:hypothetical protein [Deltaproteobacteria bacterium]